MPYITLLAMSQVRAAFDPHKKRKNPRARKAEKAKKSTALAGTLDKRNMLREGREHWAARKSGEKKRGPSQP
jgi:hypothetical protein